ncbi:hypothetical protein Tco_0368421 [Tanacetum coccineum]
MLPLDGGSPLMSALRNPNGFKCYKDNVYVHWNEHKYVRVGEVVMMVHQSIKIDRVAQRFVVVEDVMKEVKLGGVLKTSSRGARVVGTFVYGASGGMTNGVVMGKVSGVCDDVSSGGLRAKFCRFSNEEYDDECKHKHWEWVKVCCGIQWDRVGSCLPGQILLEIEIKMKRMRNNYGVLGEYKQKACILEPKRRYFKDYYSEDQYAVSIKEDTVYLCLHSPKTTKETSPIHRIQRISICCIEDIECEDFRRYQT